MDDRWHRILELYRDASRQEAEQRASFLDQACAGDVELRRQVQSLLAEDPPDGFLAVPAMDSIIDGTRADTGDVPIGCQFGAYRVLSCLGAGGMGVVYKALDTRLDRQVALKFVARDVTRDESMRQRFVHEAKAASSLDHPNICTVHEIGEAPDGQLFMAMAFYEGETLRERIGRGPLPVEEALELAIQAARGLAHAHAAGVIHRDIKPANLVVTTDGQLKILDFGIARRLNATRLTQPGTTPGTVGYMAPEVIDGAPADAQSDVWALGAVLFEMLTGRKAFPGDDAFAVMHAIRSGVVEMPRDLRAGLSEEVDRLLRRALEKRRDARFGSASEFLSAAERCLDASIHSENWRLVLPGSWPRRMRRRVMVAGLALTALLGSGAFWLVNRSATLRWVRDDAMPRIQLLLDAEDWEAAYALLQDVETVVPGDASVAETWPKLSWTTTIRSDPPGAKVFRRAYSSTADAWEELGTTPLERVRIPFGLSRIRLELEGYRPLLRTLGGGGFGRPDLPPGTSTDFNVLPEVFKLDTEASLPADKVRVSGSSVTVSGTPTEFREFLLGRYEVTNREYKQFVEAGGYTNRELWEHAFIRDGRAISWETAMALFRDKTGRAGPSTWEVGDYAEGQDDYPVSGVSWYEAAAYARFVGQELPTVHHWRRALARSSLTWMLPASNLEGAGPARVGHFQAMSWPGTFDMTGNVREWCFNALNDRRVILGAGWNDAQYLARDSIHPEPPAQPPFDRSATNGFRLAMTEDEGEVAARLRLPISEASPTDVLAREPISDEEFAIYQRAYWYDQAELAATIEDTRSSANWSRQRISFTAAYGGERMALYLYLPQNATPPFQTVVHWPGAQVVDLNSIDEYPVTYIDFILKGGRAVAFPVYQGTLERRRPVGGGPLSTARRERNIQLLKDLRRSIDYLESRKDIDTSALAFYGVSWGAEKGPPALALESRLRSAILVSGGVWPERYVPEADSVTYLSRVKVPVLLLSGEFDPLYPVETNARPWFQKLGIARLNKHVVAPSGHFVPRSVLVRETLDWLDAQLGPIN